MARVSPLPSLEAWWYKLLMKKLLRRSAFLVRPKAPFVRWANSLDAAGPQFTEAMRRETEVYLVPDLENDPRGTRVLQMVYPAIFEYELDAWHTDPKDWPEVRDLATFREWFDVEFVEMVTDLDEGELAFDPI